MKPNEDRSSAAAMLRAHGERLTPQRLLILEVLQASAEHLTADAVFEQVSARYQYVNRATIYRALTWLKEQGILSVTDLGSGQQQYQYLGAQRHHHLICLRCGTQQEFADDLVTPLARALRERCAFAPRLDHLAIFGLCSACQTSDTYE